MSLIELNKVSVNYGVKTVVKNIDLSIDQGEIVCLLGPSGCGKSTILRAIAGFEPLQQGSITINNKLVSDHRVTLPAEQRKIGMVFQDLALFPHLTVQENIVFGIRDWSTDKQQARINELLQLVGLTDYQQHYPHMLSGGQQQRIALARALAPKPQLLLLDEPFSGLDATMREVLVPEIREILLSEGISALLVSHDQMEAFAMTDKIAVINQGQIVQTDTPYNLYHKPQHRFVADFIGEGDFLSGIIISDHQVKTPLGVLEGKMDSSFKIDQAVDVLVRPDDLLHDDDSETTAEIISKQFRGSHFLYRVMLPSKQSLFCFASSHHNHEIGEEIGAKLDLDHLVLFARDE